jgi:hypothetical protein
MKYLKLFENFDQPTISGDMVFDWLPYDGEEKSAIQSSIPQTLALEELLKWVDEKNASGESSMYEKAGLYICHEKKPGRGFNRIIMNKLSPVNFKMDIFDSDYKNVQSFDSVDPASIKDVSKGASLLNKFGLFDKE